MKIITILKKKYIIFIISLFLFLAFSLLLNKTYLTIKSIFILHNPAAAILFILLNLILIPILVAATITLTIDKFQMLKKVSKRKSFIGVIGTFFGILAGSCPVCFVGLLPSLLGILGISIGLSSLLLLGFELSAVSVILLVVSLFFLSKDMTCKLKN